MQNQSHRQTSRMHVVVDNFKFDEGKWTRHLKLDLLQTPKGVACNNKFDSIKGILRDILKIISEDFDGKREILELWVHPTRGVDGILINHCGPEPLADIKLSSYIMNGLHVEWDKRVHVSAETIPL